MEKKLTMKQTHPRLKKALTIVLITHDAKVAKTAGRTLQIHTGKIIGDTLAVPPITF